MKQAKYRFNRKEGKIYRELADELFDNGNSMKMIILSASNPVYGKPFPNIPPQLWVQLTFMDEYSNWSYALLNDGKTSALSQWLAYRQEIEVNQKLALCDVITTLSFELIDDERQWFDYNFSGSLGKPGLGDRMRSLIKEKTNHPLILPIDLV